MKGLLAVIMLVQSVGWGQVLDVEQVLSDRLKWNRKLIKVRGVVVGNDHGAWLVSFRTASSNGPYHEAIAIVGPSRALQEVEFEYDVKAEIETERRYDAGRASATTHHFVITYEGVFETKTDAELKPSAGPRKGEIVYGFGQDLSLPGQIVVKSQSGAAWLRKQELKGPGRAAGKSGGSELKK